MFSELLFGTGTAHSIFILAATIALGYAVAYPLGVIGLILSLILLRRVFRVDPLREDERLHREHVIETHDPDRLTVVGAESAIGEVAGLLGNSQKRLREPNIIPAVSYSTVYPLTMFLRVVSAQILILAAL